MKKNLIIFGATGSVGAYTIINEFIRENYNIIAVGRRNDNDFFKSLGISYFNVDISESKSFEKLPELDYSCIMHFAGNMPSKMEGYIPGDYIDSIVKGTFNVLEFARRVNCKKIIFTQTRADSTHLMGRTSLVPSNLTKTFPLKGDHSVYTICKNAAVDLIEHYYNEYGINRFVLRLPTIYAYHPNKYFYVDGKKKVKAYRFLMDKAVKGEDIEIWGDPALQKEIVYVKDLVEIIRLCLVSETAKGGVYNVGNGFGISLEEQIKGIIKVFNDQKKSNVIYCPEKPNSRQFIHDISKIQTELNFKPSFNYVEMLLDFKLEEKLNRFEKIWGNGES